MASLKKASLIWPKQSRVLTQRGYSIPKSVLSANDLATIQKELVVKPEVLPQYDMGSSEFPVYFESKDRIYLPRSWATRLLGEAELDIRSDGCSLREELIFTGRLREEHRLCAAQGSAIMGGRRQGGQGRPGRVDLHPGFSDGGRGAQRRRGRLVGAVAAGSDSGAGA